MNANPNACRELNVAQLQMFQACSVLNELLNDSSISAYKYRAAAIIVRLKDAVADHPTPEGFQAAVDTLLLETAELEAELCSVRH
ncbi:MAG TPA: hypothetical protein VI457_00150 [Methylococcaceae bacterium]|nr:hypothetical protein [Methylococcaceae bacterium]